MNSLLANKIETWGRAPMLTERREISTRADQIQESVREYFIDHNLPEIETFRQGSSANNTNIRLGGDVDVAVVVENSFIPAYPSGFTREDFNNKISEYSHEEHWNNVYNALVESFGSGRVSFGKKAIKVAATETGTIDCDVVPFFQHRIYTRDGECEGKRGVALRPHDKTETVYNWPKQHKANGANKNQDTNGGYRSTVRVLKYLRDYMEELGYDAAKGISGYLCENLISNVSNYFLMNDNSPAARIDMALYMLKQDLDDMEICSTWTEGNGIKLLFSPQQRWTRTQAHAFVTQAFRLVV